MSLFLFHGFPEKNCVMLPKFLHKRPICAMKIPATDQVIDFGKHKGRMLGTLPSKYLKWVSKNLRTRDFEQWAKLADEVLQDEVYKDRLEWEFAEKILTGDHRLTGGSTVGAVSSLLEVSERFGWDNEDKIAWKRIDFALLGTSKSARIPRKGDTSLRVQNCEEIGVRDYERESKLRVLGDFGGVRVRREVRRERQKLKKKGSFQDNGRNRMNDEHGSEDDMVKKNSNLFPGREALLRKVLDSRRI